MAESNELCYLLQSDEPECCSLSSLLFSFRLFERVCSELEARLNCNSAEQTARVLVSAALAVKACLKSNLQTQLRHASKVCLSATLEFSVVRTSRATLLCRNLTLSASCLGSHRQSRRFTFFSLHLTQF